MPLQDPSTDDARMNSERLLLGSTVKRRKRRAPFIAAVPLYELCPPE